MATTVVAGSEQELSREQRFYRYRIFAVTWLAYAGLYFCRKNFSVAMPTMKETLHFSSEGLAAIIFGYNLLYLIGQFTNGPLADRWGPRLIVGIGLAVAVFSNLAMGLTATFTAFMILNCANGIGQAAGWPGLVKNMSAWYLPRERGIVMAWWGTCYVLGAYVATIFATACLTNSSIAPGLGWHRVFFGPAVVLAIITVVYVLYTRNHPSDAGLPEIVEQEEPKPAAAEEDATIAEAAPAAEVSIIREVLAEPAVWVVSASYFFMKLSRYALTYWLPLYMVENLHYAKSDAGTTSAYYELAGFFGAVAAGYISDKLFQSRRFSVGALMLFGLAGAFLLQIKLSQMGITANAIGIALLGFLTFGPDTLVTGAGAMDLGTKRGAATAAGFINGVGSAGQLLSPIVVVWVAKRFGWDSLFFLFAVLSAIGALLLSTLWNFKARRVPSTA